MVIAGLTPSDWEITIIDENLGVPDYSVMPKPDFLGITAFASPTLILAIKDSSRRYD